MKFKLETFERYKEKGIQKLRNEEWKEAKYYLLKAAEYLFEVAQESQGRIREQRIKNAQKLLKLAKKIDENRAKKKESRKKGISATEKDDEIQASKWILTTKPNISFADVAGLDDVKRIIRKRVIYPFLFPEQTQKFKMTIGGGILLYGPPGTGKTFIAKAIAAEIDAAFFCLNPSDIMSKWVGEAEKNVAQLFEEVKKFPKAVVFLDEVEALISRRGGGSTVMNRVIPEFLAHLDGMNEKKNCLLFLGATNRPWDIDEAAMRTGRFTEIIYVGLPDFKARLKILEINLKDVPVSDDIDFAEIAKLLEGYSGADIKGICQSAKEPPYEREITSGNAHQIQMPDFLKAIEKRRPSVDAKTLQKHKEFAR